VGYHAKAFLAAAAAATALCSFAGQANAAFSFTEDTLTVPSSTVIAPNSVTDPAFFASPVTGSQNNVRRSPFGNNTTPYSVIDTHLNGAKIPINSATYNSTIAGGSTSLSIFWGSPDSFNNISFWSGLNGTGTELFCITGGGKTAGCTGSPLQVASLLDSNGGNGTRLHDFVRFFDLSGAFESVVLSTTKNAFEYTSLAGLSNSSTPLPAALPLYAAGMGVMGFFGWRRKRKSSAASA
jgi:hypothetical protein